MRLGIDIGTHTARAAFLDAAGRIQLIQPVAGQLFLPALVRQTMHGLVVGAEAQQSLAGNYETTVSGCTRLMGRAGHVPPALLARLPYSVRDIGGELSCNLLYHEVSAATIYGSIARALVDAANRIAPIESIVLTIPASAEDRFRVQARAALEAQGLIVQRLVSQPAAALLALDTELGDATCAAVVSCGGGTTDVSIAERHPGGWRISATAGDPLLGGDDMAWHVATHLNDRIRSSTHYDIFAAGDSRAAAYGLRAATEEAMRRLVEHHEWILTLDHGAGFGRDIVASLGRTDLYTWLEPAMQQIGALCRRVCTTAGKLPEAVVLIGDWAFLPNLPTVIAAAFNITRTRVLLHTPETAAVCGAAILATDSSAMVWDVTPFPLGINCYYGDEELLSPIIAANTPIPTPLPGEHGAYTDSFQTRYPDQTLVRLDVLQYRGPRDAQPRGAEKVRPDECEKLGSWEFSGLSPQPGRCADFTVTFSIDADGILQLFARETATGHTLNARVDRAFG